MRLHRQSVATDAKSEACSFEPLPKFSFEGNDQDRAYLMSTDRIFDHLATSDISYDAGRYLLHTDDDTVKEIVVRPLTFSHLINTDYMTR